MRHWKVMEHCTCGADLPPNARFCPRCGKPQREEDLVREAVQPPQLRDTTAAPLPAPEMPAPISFHNGAAVRSALLAAPLGLVLLVLISALPLPPVLQPLSFIAAGLIAVSLYRRRSGAALETMSGARLGWIAGVFCFLTFLMLFTISLIAMSDPAVAAEMRRMMSAQGVPPESIDQFFQALRNPASVIGTIGIFFFLFTAMAAVGGAIGAWLGRSRDPAR
jgi:hypothetical protein